MLCIVHDNNKVIIENSSPVHQTFTLTVISKNRPKIGPFNRRQVVHPRPQTPQGESVAKPETPLLIILSIVYVNVICRRSMETTPIHFSTRMSVDRNIQERWTAEETVTQTLMIEIQNIVNIR